jgi:hypothetical protein
MSDGETPFIKEYALVGELVLTVSALEHQLTDVLIALLHLTPSPMLFPVVAALDTRRKIDIFKARIAHMPSGSQWKESAMKYVNLAERAQKGRNIACHLMPKIKDRELRFVPIDAARFLKDLDLSQASIKEVKSERLEADLLLAQNALSQGEALLANLERMNQELNRRRGESS